MYKQFGCIVCLYSFPFFCLFVLCSRTAGPVEADNTLQQVAAMVEQAFMSHAGDEEKLADPDFRQLIAEKIGRG